MAVPYTFATATSSIPLSQLDANFATGITLGNTTVYLGNTTTSFGNVTLTNATISSVAVTFPNSFLANSSVTIGSTNVSLGGTATTVAGLTLTSPTINGGTSTATQNLANVTGTLGVANGGTGLTSVTAGYLLYGNGTSAFSSSSNLYFSGSNLGIGTSSPTSIANYKTITLNGTTGSIIDLQSGGTTLGRLQTDTNYSLALWTATATPMVFGTNYTEQMRLTSTGYLGIGTSSPSALLTVNGDALINGLTVGKGGGAVGTNTAVGFQAYFSNQTGANNVAIGYQAGYSNTTGANNFFGGYQAGYKNTTGQYNTFIGYQAGYSSAASGNSFNTCVGYYAGGSLTTAIANTFIGSANNGTGYTSGGAITTGSKNTIIGSYSGNNGGLDIRTASNYIVLSDGDGNPRQIIDGSGNLGLGVTPSAWYASYRAIQLGQGSSLSGYSSLNITNLANNWYPNAANTDKYITSDYATSLQQYQGQFKFFVAPSGTAGDTIPFTQAMTLDNSGNLLVGGTSGGQGKFRVISTADSYAGGGFCSVNTSGNYWNINMASNAGGNDLYFGYNNSDKAYINSSTGAFVPISDKRLKKNIVNIEYGLKTVLELNPVAYNMNDQEDTDVKSLGFIAQDAMQIIPESVSQMQSGMYGMDKTAVIPILVKAIQEQQTLIESLTQRIATLENK